MKTAWLCVTVVGCFVMKMTNASLATAWTKPAISSINGHGTLTDNLTEVAPTFPQLAVTDANAYNITSQIPSGTFAITAGNGTLALAAGKQLDYETVKQHVLVVTASDGTTTGTATITINIADANDNPPVFPSSGYSACVVDKAKAGTSVLTVSTTDVDTTTDKNAISAMTIIAGNTNTDFAIATNGIITLAKAVDMATTPRYNLTVKADDSETGTALSGTTTVSVTVAEKCGGSGVGILAASLFTMLVGVMTSLSSL